LIIFSR